MGAAAGEPGGGGIPMMRFSQAQLMFSPDCLTEFKLGSLSGGVVSNTETA